MYWATKPEEVFDDMRNEPNPFNLDGLETSEQETDNN